MPPRHDLRDRGEPARSGRREHVAEHRLLPLRERRTRQMHRLAPHNVGAATQAQPAYTRHARPRQTSRDASPASIDVPKPSISVEGVNQAAWAMATACRLLAEPLPQRWSHTQGVAARARDLAPILGADAALVESAAWLHDIGYSPELVVTGFHPLDGARYLRDHERADQSLCRLVAHHSYAALEAEERGLTAALRVEFDAPREDLLDALTYCDMTTTPTGERTTVTDRLSEIVARYGDEHIVGRFVRRAEPKIIEATRRIRSMLDA